MFLFFFFLTMKFDFILLNIEGKKFRVSSVRDDRYLFRLHSSMEFPLFFVKPKTFSDYMTRNNGFGNEHLVEFLVTLSC